MKKKVLIIIICSAAAAIVIAAAVIFMWRSGTLLPGWIRWEDKTEEVLFQETGTRYTAALEGKKVLVRSSSGEIFWNSPEGVLVQDMMLEDIDGDGNTELLLLCWKVGKYGNKVPRFEKEENKWFQHIYIYEYREGELRPIWMASELGMEVEDWGYDRENEWLIITETGGRETSWGWFSWGLDFIGEIEEKN